MLELELSYYNNISNQYDWIYYETSEGIASATFRYTNITKVDASRYKSELFVSIPNRETLSNNYGTPLIKNNYRNTKEVESTSFLFCKSKVVNYYYTEVIAARDTFSLLVNKYYKDLITESPDLLVNDIYISMFKYIIKDIWKFNSYTRYDLKLKEGNKLSYTSLSNRFPPGVSVREQLSLGSSVIKELGKDTEESLGKKNSKEGVMADQEEGTVYRNAVDLGKFNYYMINNASQGGLYYFNSFMVHDQSKGNIFYKEYINLFNTSFGHMNKFNKYNFGYSYTRLDNRDYGSNVYSNTKETKYTSEQYILWKSTFGVGTVDVVGVHKVDSFELDINELSVIMPHDLLASIESNNKSFIYSDKLTNVNDKLYIITPADMLACQNIDLIVNMRDADTFIVDDVIVNQRPGDVVFNKQQEILKAYMNAYMTKDIDIAKAYADTKFNDNVNIDKAYIHAQINEHVNTNKAYADVLISQKLKTYFKETTTSINKTYDVVYRTPPIIDRYSKMIVPFLADRNIKVNESIIINPADRLTRWFDTELSFKDTAAKNLYDNYIKHDIISVKKGSIGSYLEEAHVIYDRIAKKAKEFQAFIDIPVRRPDIILNIDPEESLMYNGESKYKDFDVYYFDAIGLAKPILNLVPQDYSKFLGKLWKLSMPTDLNNMQIPDGKKHMDYDYYEEMLFRPIASPSPAPLISRITKNNIKDTYINKYNIYSTKVQKYMFLVNTFMEFYKNHVPVMYHNTMVLFNREKRDTRYLSHEVNFVVDNKSIITFNQHLFITRELKDFWHKATEVDMTSNSRDSYIEQFSRRMMCKMEHNLRIEDQKIAKFLTKKEREVALIRAYLTIESDRANRGTTIEHTYKFYWNKTKETNKKKYVDIYNNYSFFAGPRVGELNDRTSVPVYAGVDRTTTVEDTIHRTHTNSLEIGFRSIEVDHQAFFISSMPFKDIYMEKYNNFIFRYELKDASIYEKCAQIDIIKIIEMYQGEIPVVTALRFADVNEAVRYDMPYRDTLEDRWASFIIEKGKLDTFIPKLQNINQDSIARSIVLGEQYKIKTKTSYNKFFDSFTAGVDELILPQTDFDYSVFKEGLVDPITGRPAKQSTMIDDTTFIAKRPTRHPLPEFKDLAKEFIAIDAPLLKHLLEVFYSIWQDNIFKFGAMEMRDAVAKMLEYLDLYIDYNIPECLHKQGKRVIRFIRWYGEFAIASNAEYKVTMVYEDLKSELHKGSLSIPNTCTNLYINPNKYILTNQILGQEAILELHLSNFIDSQVTFMDVLHGEGYLEVYLNDELIDTVGISKRDNCYEIPKMQILNNETEVHPNEFKLKYIPSGMGYVDLANIVVKNYKFSDFTTEYSPKVGTGNMALNDMMKKISVMAELYDNNQEFIQQTINGNLAITSLVDKLINYFNLHHAGKQKGKRLTIKK